jgi:predicted acylesterase/phospholipase RssA
MADILEDVQQTLQVALNNYLKEHATHRLARTLALNELHLTNALIDVYPDILDSLDNPAERKIIFTQAVSDIFSLDRVSAQVGAPSINQMNASALYDRFLVHLSSEPNHVVEEFIKILEHFRAAETKVRDYHKLDSHQDTINADTITSHLRGMHSEAVERSMVMMERLDYEERHGKYRQPEVLILQGGGARGLVYSAVMQTLEDLGMLKGIKRVAGTSAGAMMGLPIALGYDAATVNEIVVNSRFSHFYAESTRKFKFVAKMVELLSNKKLEEHPWHEGDLLQTFAEKYFLPQLAKCSDLNVKQWTTWTEDRVQEELRHLDQFDTPGGKLSLQEIFDLAMDSFKVDQWKKGQSPDVLQFEGLLGRSRAYQAALTCIRLKRPAEITQSDSIEEFIGDIIQERLKIVLEAHFDLLDPPIKTLDDRRNITFTQLKALGEIDPNYGFKEFGVAISDSHMLFTPGNIKRKYLRDKILKGKRAPDPGTGDYDKGGDFKPVFVRAPSALHPYTDMPIKKAVRASMNLPFLFKAMKINGMRNFDGGLVENFPHKMFADEYKTQEEVRANTIGFKLTALEENIENEALQDLARNGTKSMAIKVPFAKQTFSQKLEKVRDYLIHPIDTAKSVAGGVVGAILSRGIKQLMRANSMPSMESHENIGLINTGTVGTGDFHVSKQERHELLFAGSISALNLFRWDADKHLRFAKGRLTDLVTLEDRLLQERGLLKHEALPKKAFLDAESLTQSLMGGIDSYDLGTVLIGGAKAARALLRRETSHTMAISAEPGAR